MELVGAAGDELVLFDYMDGPKVFANLVRRRGGVEVWRAAPPLPTSPDAWVSARVEGDEVVAQSWSGFRVRLDLADGSEIEREFTK